MEQGNGPLSPTTGHSVRNEWRPSTGGDRPESDSRSRSNYARNIDLIEFATHTLPDLTQVNPRLYGGCVLMKRIESVTFPSQAGYPFEPLGSLLLG